MNSSLPTHPDQNTASLREAIELSLTDGSLGLALHQAELLWLSSPGLTTAGFIKSRIKPLAPALNFNVKHVTILRSFTVETMTPLLEACGLLNRICLEIRLGQYNAYLQELMDGDFGPCRGADLTLIVLHTRTAAPALWFGTDLTNMNAAGTWLCDNMQKSLEIHRASHASPVVVQLLDSPPLNDGDSFGAERRLCVQSANERLRKIAAAIPDCYVCDISGMVDMPGQIWYDERNWKVAKIPFRNERAPELASRWFQQFRPLLGESSKVLVIDLDNTIWSGILGEDGAENLMMAEGSAFREVQRALLDLKNRGILLAIASKNDEAAAFTVLATHPDCLIRPDDIAAMRINWSAKPDNIRSMADELALGLDAFMFLDDNPAERAQVARELPMVCILPHLDSPAANAAMLTSHPALQRLKITAEDVARTDLYRTRRERNAAAGTDAAAREVFLNSLNQQIVSEPLSDDVFVRLADLERKTNQFNLRTRRFTEVDLRRFAAGPESFIMAFRVLDRFGDNGIVGLGVVTLQGETAVIENLLMSCRVIGRRVEYEMLNEIAGHAKRLGAAQVQGGFATTGKNGPAADFFQRAGFSLTASEAGSGLTLWSRSIDHDMLTETPAASPASDK